MIDLKLTKDGDLELTMKGDVSPTQSVCQAVRIRLLWFLEEWRLGPELGFPYFEEVFIKNPSDTKIKHLIRETVMSVDEVTDVESIDFPSITGPALRQSPWFSALMRTPIPRR